MKEENSQEERKVLREILFNNGGKMTSGEIINKFEISYQPLWNNLVEVYAGTKGKSGSAIRNMTEKRYSASQFLGQRLKDLRISGIIEYVGKTHGIPKGWTSRQCIYRIKNKKSLITQPSFDFNDK